MSANLELLNRLNQHQVDFVLIGGFAAAAYGATTVTQDIDVCFRFQRENIARLIAALRGTNPRFKVDPEKFPFLETPETYENYKNLYLVTDVGYLDLLGTVTGVGGFDVVEKGAISIDLASFSCRVMGLQDLIRAKHALGRPKDLRVAAELEIISQRRNNE